MRDVFDNLVAIAYRVEPGFQNAIRWKVPTFTLNDNWNHWIFSIAGTQKGVSLSFHKGRLLHHPKRVLCGDGKYLRTILFQAADEVDESTIADLMREGIQHQTDM